EADQETSSGHRPDVDAARHVGAGDQTAIGRNGHGAYPVLELSAARLTQALDELAVGQAPDLDAGVAAGRQDMLVVRMEGDIGDAVFMARSQFLELLAGVRVEQVDLARQPAALAARPGGQPLAIGRESRGTHALLE